MKKYFIFFIFLIFYCNNLFAQNYIQNIKTYTKKDGLALGHINSMAYDNNGWLWIGGFNSTVASGVFNDEQLTLQRFNGVTFDTFTFDLKTKSKSNKLTQIIKRNDGKFYLNIDTDFNTTFLYLFNPLTLKLDKIKLPIKTKKTSYIVLFNTITLENNEQKEERIYIFISEKNNTNIYILNDDLSFEYKFSIPNNKEPQLGYTFFLPLKDYCVVSEFRQGTNAFDWNGKLIKAFNINEKFKFKNNSFHIYNSFIKKNKQFVFFNGIKVAYQYNIHKKEFEKSNVKYKSEVSMDDTMNNSAILINNKEGSSIIRYFKSGKENITYIKDLKNANFIFSENLKTDIWIASERKLQHIIFHNSKVKTYLNQYSIRSILKIENNKYLVATEFAGLFTINVEKDIVKPYVIKHKNKIFKPTIIRSLIKEKNTIWTNYNAGILKINTLNKAVKFWRYYPVECMLQTDSNTIYYGTIYKALIQFDTKKEHNNPLIKTDSSWILDIKKYKNNLFVGTNKGLITYNLDNKKTQFFDNKNGLEDDYIISISKHPKYKILIGTKTGLLYSYHKNQFELIYRDNLNVGIASVLSIEKNVLWINTFNGIVNYNLKTKEVIRYSTNEGLSHNEMNRYSYLKTENNHFFVGSIKGLNYFNPKDLKKQKDSLTILLSKVIHFNKNKRKLIQNQHDLENLKKINLPAENKFLHIEFGLNSLIQNNVVYKYRFNEQKWTDLENQNKLQIQNLEAGSYNLEIKAFNNLNVGISNSIRLKIISKQIFYKTWWFALSGIFIIVSISLFLIKQSLNAKNIEQQFSHNLLIAQEEERKRISRDLHDSIGQNLMLLKRKAAKSKNKDLEELAINTLNEMRNITKALHPSILEKLGLTSAIKNFINDVDKNTEIFFTTEIDNIDNLITKENEVHLFRVVQESITNLSKHANSKVAFVKISIKENTIIIKIEDKGKGFNIDLKSDFSYSLGMKTLEERSSILNANFTIKSDINIGTILEFIIPFK